MSAMSQEGTEPNLTPILDMVFQLITFFMLVINFKSASMDLSLRLPVVGSARPGHAIPLAKPRDQGVPGQRIPPLRAQGDEPGRGDVGTSQQSAVGSQQSAGIHKSSVGFVILSQRGTSSEGSLCDVATRRGTR